jgi:hypothetical protein
MSAREMVARQTLAKSKRDSKGRSTKLRYLFRHGYNNLSNFSIAFKQIRKVQKKFIEITI